MAQLQPGGNATLRVFQSCRSGLHYPVAAFDESFPRARLMTWSEPEVLSVLANARARWSGRGRNRPVFPMLSASLFVADQNAWLSLAPLLEKCGGSVPIYVEDEPFVAMFVRPFDCLDLSRAVVSFSPSGRVLVQVKQWAFRDGIGGLPPVFRIPRLGAPVFFSESFAERCKSFPHSGLRFSEVEYR